MITFLNLLIPGYGLPILMRKNAFNSNDDVKIHISCMQVDLTVELLLGIEENHKVHLKRIWSISTRMI